MKASRRAVIARSLIGMPFLAFLAACGIVTSNTTNGVTTLTLNTAKLDTLVKAIIAGIGPVIANPLIAAALGPSLPIVQGILVAISAADAALVKQAGSSQKLTFDSTSIPAALTSIGADLQTLFGDVNTAMTAVGKKLDSTTQNLFSAVETVIAEVVALIPVFSSATTAAAVRSTAVLPVSKMPLDTALGVISAATK